MFDNTCKFLVENFSDDFTNWLLGKRVKLTALEPTELSSQPIRADAVILLQSEEIVLHLEFQTRPDPTMGFRILDYAIRIYRKFPNKQLRQIVIYLLPTNSPMVYETTFVTANTRHEFEVIRLWEQPAEVLQQWVGLLPLTVLAKTAEPEAMLRQVAQKIEQIEDQTQQRNLASSTAILAGLVLEQKIIERILRSDMMRESSMYQAILAEGEAKGKAEGKAEGRAEGEAKARAEAEARIRQVAQNMLRSGISIEMTAQLTGLTVAEVEALQQQPS